MPKFLYDLRQAASVLSVGRSKLYELMNDGAIKSVKIGNRRLIPAEGIEAYVSRLIEEA